MTNKTITSITLIVSSLCFPQELPAMQKALANQKLTQENIESYALAIELSDTVIVQIGEDSNFGGIWYTRDLNGKTILHIGQKKYLRRNTALEKNNRK